MGHEALAIAPLDEHNLRLLASVRPDGWKNPTPAPRYNMVVIGAGTAGLVTAAGAAGLGAKVALIERDLMGGDCLNFGCVPSKALIAASRVAASARDAKRFGVIVPDGVRVDFPAVMERMRTIRAELATNDSAARFKSLGVDVFRGAARFTGRDSIEVEGATLRFSRATIATGARATAPPIPGLAEAGYLTNETVFSLSDLPRRLVVIGAGPIGCELAQAFRRFGSDVTMLEVMPQILIREDRDAAKLVESALIRDGVRIVTSCNIERVEKRGTERVLVTNHASGARGNCCRRNPDRRGTRARHRRPQPRSGGRRVRSRRRRQGQRLSADHQPAHLRRRRCRFALQIHACRRRDRANRDSQCAVLRTREGERNDSSVVHLHRPGNRSRRYVRT